MDLETENRLAALLMDEARRLRAEADKEGVHAYLRQPKVRGRPNARFLTATVLGVQQANKAVEVDELWRAREKEIELENKLISKMKIDEKYKDGKHHDSRKSCTSRPDKNESSSSKRGVYEDAHSYEDDGLRDEEIERFLNSRVKRGRGAVGSRMDEPGPYPVHLPSDNDRDASDIRTHEEWEGRVLGPEKPSSLLRDSSDPIRTKMENAKSSSSKKHRIKEKHQKEERLKKKRKKEKRSKHRH